MNNESTIHDLGYRRYDGARIGAGGAWRALFFQGFRAMFGLGRPAKAKVVPVFVLVVTNLPALATLAAFAASQGTTPIRYAQIITPQLLMFVLFVAAQAPEVLSRDQQHKVLPLILTRDVTRLAYGTARLAAIMLALFIVSFAPLLILYVGQIAAAVDPAAAFDTMGDKIWPSLGQAILTTLCIGGVSAALAAWTPRRAYATAAIIGTFLVLAAIAGGLDDMAGVTRETADLVNPLRSLNTQAMLFFGEKTRRMERIPPMSLWVYAAMMSGIGIVGSAILQLRINRVKT